MRLILSIAILLTGSFSFASVSGRVVCAQVAPKTISFELVRFFSKEKSYSGTYDFPELRFSGSYNPADSHFVLEISKLNEFSESTASVFYLRTKLQLGDFVQVRFDAGQPIEMYCNAVPSGT